jgi:hypothetical protein
MATPSGGYWLDGKRLPSVTTILGRFKDSKGLMIWQYNQGREHERIQSANNVIEQARAVAPHVPNSHALASALWGNDWDVRPLPYAPRDAYDKRAAVAEAALAGTIAHDMIEQYVLAKGLPQPDLIEAEMLLKHGAGTANAPGDDVQRRARNSFRQFLEWWENTRLTVTHTEIGLKSTKHRFGGTPDAIGLDNRGRVVLIDWKTSNAVYGDYLYQLAAYALLIEENHPELKPEGFHLLRVAKESADFAHHYFGELDEEKEAFILMTRLYEIDARTRKRA